mmetsp:Transcript_11952/g.16531  ORF Transcript_11952/g.16531 Transcript_11952/m.16531 type:complete len:566 (-) Transcript_11952:90-1787(-)|eukprot:CAMPEP_0185730942 /NCGR_PEP_ID=MMETSP1171-20130828/11468_1 /TAXON_ID=374046 /ORGANISM="Helicotheca tamensis, Strain CCMP826" /LENGTH=565 /DNA_ID=CAMNT_0028400093 /DNA_START=5 /DNA_END=1702 /DNA_ORIENTATION=+
MPRLTKISLPFFLIAASSVPNARIYTATAIQDCQTDVPSGECIGVDDFVANNSLKDTAKELGEALLSLADGAYQNRKNNDTTLHQMQQLLKDVKKIQPPLDETEEEEEVDSEDLKKFGDNYYADRYVQTILDILSDEECTSGTIDVSSPNFDVKDVIRVFNKCRLVHLRNFYDTDFLKEYKLDVTSYMQGIASGRISEQGQTNYAGEPYYFAENAKYRFDLCFTEDLMREEIMANDLLMRILEDDYVLDYDVSMLDFGAIIAEPGAPIQRWHRDGGNYIFRRSFATSRVAGHDLPPFAVAVITPLLHVTMDHGPTEFCMGSTALVSMDVEHPKSIPVKDPTLREKLEEFIDASGEYCHPEAWRAPVLGFGDVLLFDYNMMHRGGANKSPDLRTVIYNTYVRPWYKDPNFSTSEAEKALHAKDMDESPISKLSERMQEVAGQIRIAIPDEIKPEDPEARANIQFDDLEKLSKFRPSRYADIHESHLHGREIWEFAVTNTNVDIEGLELCYDEPDGCTPFPAGANLDAEGRTNDKLFVLTPDGKEIMKIVVGPHQEQVIVSSQHVKY